MVKIELNPARPRHRGRSWGFFLAAVLAGLCVQVSLGDQPVGQPGFARKAEADFLQAQAGYQSGTNQLAATVAFARACFNLGDFATNDTSRAELAVQGIEACRDLIKTDPKAGAAHYWLGMNLGQLARTKLLGALALVREMEREFKLAWSLDPKVDHAGPARSLGVLYREAPGWPTSIGSKHKAREWLDRAVKADPDFPENWLVLCETHLKWSEPEDARAKLHQLALLWPKARTNFTGAFWEADWTDWSARRREAQSKMNEQDADNIGRKGR